MSEEKTTKRHYSLGTKLYRYDENNKLIVYRVYRYDPKKEQYLLKNLGEKTTEIMGYDAVHNNLVKLNEDGIVSFNIIEGERQDVMVCIHRLKDLESAVPFAVCRQDVVDIFKMYSDPPKKGIIYAGISVNRRNCPAEMRIEDFMLCDDVLYTRFVNVYLDDTLDTIMDIMYMGRFDKVLENLQKYRKGSNLIGYQRTVKDLLLYHNFMYDFHEAFDVVEVPFPIVKEAEDLLKEVIGQMEQKVISNVYIIPYSKTINTSEFNRPYRLMTPEWDKCKPENRLIYIVGYDVDEDADYLQTKYGTNDKEEIIKKMGFSIM